MNKVMLVLVVWGMGILDLKTNGPVCRIMNYICDLVNEDSIALNDEEFEAVKKFVEDRKKIYEVHIEDVVDIDD